MAKPFFERWKIIEGRVFDQDKGEYPETVVEYIKSFEAEMCFLYDDKDDFFRVACIGTANLIHSAHKKNSFLVGLSIAKLVHCLSELPGMKPFPFKQGVLSLIESDLGELQMGMEDEARD